MKIISIIIILFIFQSCQAKDFKLEINKAFKENNISKIDKLLIEYHQINGSDYLLESSLIKLNILKKDYKRVFELYQNTKYIKIKKDKEINKQIADFIISSNKKIEINKRLPYYEAALKTFPYSELIYNEYLNTLLNLNKTSKAFKVYLQYDEIFNKTNKFLVDIIISKLKQLYLKNKDMKILDLITKIKSNVSFLESEIISNPKLLLHIKQLPKTFNSKILKKIIPNKNYSLSKAAVKFFILTAKEEEVKEYIKKLYLRANHGLKILIYSNYYQRFNKEIDINLIKNLIKSTNPFDVKTAIEIIISHNIIKYKDQLKKILGKPKDFRCSKKYLLDALFILDKEYLKSFVLDKGFPKFKATEKKLKLTKLKLALGIKIKCDICMDLLKDTEVSEFIKANALSILIKMKKDISFFNEYDNYVYYLIFLENNEYLDNKTLQKMSITAYIKWQNYKLLVKYLGKLNINEIEKFLAKDVFKKIKDQYHLKLVYYSIALQKTNAQNDNFNKFILKNRFHKVDYIDMFNFTKKHLNILIKLYIVENRNNMKLKLLEKIIDILNK